MAAAENEETASLFFGLVDVTVDKSTGILLVVIIMGALGGFIHAATSFASYAGNRTLRVSWLWWFWLRIPLGATLALGFYFVLRAGFVGVQESSVDINSYGAAAFAFLTGAFSKQAIDKLEELFNTLASHQDRRRGAPGQQGRAAASDHADQARPGCLRTATSNSPFKGSASARAPRCEWETDSCRRISRARTAWSSACPPMTWLRARCESRSSILLRTTISREQWSFGWKRRKQAPELYTPTPFDQVG